MYQKRILTIQDISCVGQCSLTVALPIISACGVEAAVLPSAVLSTHTGGFDGYTFRDLTEDMPMIKGHWVKEGITFDAVYTGYLGSTKQISYVKDIMSSVLNEKGLRIVDPAMADNGKLYHGFDESFVAEMSGLCSIADIILPNITEACFMTGYEYKESYDEDYISGLLKELSKNQSKSIVLTGVGYDEESTGVVVKKGNDISYYKHKRIPVGSHGTGDVYASAFTGAIMRGYALYDAAKIAADYTLACIENTTDDKEHWYGVKFEGVLGKLVEVINR